MSTESIPGAGTGTTARDQEAVRALCRAGDVHREQAHYSQAESLYHCDLAQARQVYGDDAPEISAILNNLAMVYKYTGEYERAWEL